MALHQNLAEPDARALAFAALIAANLGLVLVDRSLSASVFAAFRRPNAALWWVVVATAAILAGVILFSAGAGIVPLRAAARQRCHGGTGRRSDCPVAARV